MSDYLLVKIIRAKKNIQNSLELARVGSLGKIEVNSIYLTDIDKIGPRSPHHLANKIK